MARSSTSWKKGQSGNPKGEGTQKGRQLTRLIERALSKTIDHNGSRMARRRVLAELISEAATTGIVRFPDRTMVMDVDQWTNHVRWLYNRIEGTPPQSLEVDNIGDPMIVLSWGDPDEDDADTATAAS